MRHFLLFAAILSFLFSSPALYAQRIPSGQDVGATTRVEKREKEKGSLPTDSVKEPLFSCGRDV